MPFVAHAQLVATGSPRLQDIFNVFVRWLIVLPRILTFAAIALILYRVVSYIWKKGHDASVEETKKAFGGLISSIGMLFIALSIWGIMAMLSSTFGIGPGGTLPLEGVPTVETIDEQSLMLQ